MLCLSHLQWLSIELDGLNPTYLLVALVGDTEWCTNSELSRLDGDSHNDGVLDVEHIALDDFKDAGEHGLGAVLGLALISALLEMSLKLIEQVIDDVSSENGETVLICESLGVGHNLDVESKNCSELFLHMVSLE